MKKRIIVRDIIRDIAEGMSNDRLMEKYQVSRGQLQGILEHLSNLRRKRIDTMVSDLDYGMSPPDFMRKYGLTLRGLVKVLNTLIAERIASKSKISNMRSDPADATGNREAQTQGDAQFPVRLFPRNRDKLRRTG